VTASSTSENTVMSNSTESLSKQELSLKRFINAISSVPSISQVEELIKTKFETDVEVLNDIPSYLLSLGGKRIRPVLTLLTGKALGLETPPKALIEIAAGIELIHMATLMHDDIIDNSPLRRHKPSPYAKYGLGNTLLSGDFLLVRAFSLCARLPRQIIDATEVACIELTEGESMEFAIPLNDHTITSSLEIARRKTASLFRLSTFSAGLIAGCNNEAITHLTKFGESLGIAFQILDDILDVTSSEEELGKKAGTDIRERKPSMVNVLWLAENTSLSKKMLTDENLSDGYINDSLTEIKSGNCIERARKLAIDYADEARMSLLEAINKGSGKVDSDSIDSLLAILDYTLERVK